jgi:hypothetical protein
VVLGNILADTGCVVLVSLAKIGAMITIPQRRHVLAEAP